jgi:hypothetical protein
MTVNEIMNEVQPREEWLEQFWAEEQKRADALGMNIIEYQMQANGGILRPTILKLLRHAKAHPTTCPPDCAFQTSMERLKEQCNIK